jgi:5-oxoprolinase (ATP-hydrolysing)
VQEPAATVLEQGTLEQLRRRLDALDARARQTLLSRGFDDSQVASQRFLNLRFSGTDVALMVAADAMQGYEAAFLEAYEREFGFLLQDRDIVVDDIRRGAGLLSVFLLGHAWACSTAP